MTPYTSIQKAILLLGEGANGKSTYLAAVNAFLGRGNVSGLSLHKLESDRFACSRLVGKLANICPDLPSADLAGTSIFKAITGGDTLVAEYKFKDSFEFVPYSRLIFSANQPPRSKDATYAFFRRWIVVPFLRTFEESEQIPRQILDAKLADPKELSGVLNKALGVLPRLRSKGIIESDSMRASWAEFREITDPLAVWLENWIDADPDGFTTKADLLNAYSADCREAGHSAPTKQAFGRAIGRLRPDLAEGQRTVDGKLEWAWLGIRLRITPKVS
jgi:putative DNA primase/helicase